MRAVPGPWPSRFNGIYGDVFKLPEPYRAQGRRPHHGPDQSLRRRCPSPIPEGTGRVPVMEQSGGPFMRQFKRAITDCDTENCVRFRPGQQARRGQPDDHLRRRAPARASRRSSQEFAGLRLRGVQARRGRVLWWRPCGPSGRRPARLLAGQGVSGERVPVPARRRRPMRPPRPCGRSIRRWASWLDKFGKKRKWVCGTGRHTHFCFSFPGNFVFTPGQNKGRQSDLRCCRRGWWPESAAK